MFSFVSTKDPKNNGLPIKQKKRTPMKTVPSVQYGDRNIQDMLPVVYYYNSNGTCTTPTTKIDSFDEKTKNSSTPSPENGEKNVVSSG